MATAGSNTDPLGSGEPSGPTGANNLTLLGYNQDANRFSQPVGQAQVSQGATNLAQAGAYESGILSGDRSTVLSAAAPEISSLLSSYDAARKSAGQLAPRGGGRSAYLNELPFKESGDINALIQKQRPQAAQQLAKVGEAEGYLGSEQQSLAQQAVQTSLSFLLGKAGIQLQSAQLQGEQGQAMGQAAGQATAQLIMMAAAA